jgi:hypothetical protein
MNIEIINDKMPTNDVRGCGYRGLNMVKIVLFRPGGTTRDLTNLPGSNLKVSDETQRAVPNVLKLSSCYFARA